MVRQLAHRADGGPPPESSLLAGGPAAGADPLAVGEELMALFAARSAARGLLRLWTGDLAGADEDLTAVVTRIRGGLRLRYPGQALGYLAETAFRLGRWDEGPGSR